MQFSVLGSGSRGNSVYIESSKTAILIDAGFSGKEIERRLKLIDRDFTKIRGICVTHEHHDHVQGVGVISRRKSLPVCANSMTFLAGEKELGSLYKRVEFETGNVFEIDDLFVRSFRLSHDAADPVGFVVGDGKAVLGYCTDTGKTSHLMMQRLSDCDAVILEFNHDLELLKNGPYPLELQQRVKSNRGHLSNEDAARFLSEIMTSKVQHIILAHLSETNNTPILAQKAACEAVLSWSETHLHIARQDTVSNLFKLNI